VAALRGATLEPIRSDRRISGTLDEDAASSPASTRAAVPYTEIPDRPAQPVSLFYGCAWTPGRADRNPRLRRGDGCWPGAVAPLPTGRLRSTSRKDIFTFELELAALPRQRDVGSDDER